MGTPRQQMAVPEQAGALRNYLAGSYLGAYEGPGAQYANQANKTLQGQLGQRGFGMNSPQYTQGLAGILGNMGAMNAANYQKNLLAGISARPGTLDIAEGQIELWKGNATGGSHGFWDLSDWGQG